MLREYSIIELLLLTLDRVPIHLRGITRLEFDVVEGSLAKNVESIYQQSVNRLTCLSYYLEWSYRLSQHPTTLPPDAKALEMSSIPFSFHDISSAESNDISILNNSFTQWINRKIVRDLDEFLQYYLLGVYETCLIAQHAGRPIEPRELVEAKQASRKFEKSSLKERLKLLKKLYGLNLTHKAEIYSLNEMRHIFSHFNGVVQKKFANKDNVFKVSWPTNIIKMKHSTTGKLVLYENIIKPPGEEYVEMQVTWLANPKVVSYKIKECIELTHTDLNELVFFYLYVFSELQANLVEYMSGNGLNMRPFIEYSSLSNIWMTSEEQIPI